VILFLTNADTEILALRVVAESLPDGFPALVAANPVDAFVRSGRYPTVVTFPFVLGRDLVGTVAACGPDAGFRVGDRVWANSLGHDGRQGTFAVYAAVPAERCYRLSGGIDPELAVAAAHPATTAYLAWFVHACLHAGQCVYLGGGAGVPSGRDRGLRADDGGASPGPHRELVGGS